MIGERDEINNILQFVPYRFPMGYSMMRGQWEKGDDNS
jgi:hypothetical protein